MCGIIGYTGVLNAPKVLLGGLHELEYRGYDSAGIACFTKDGINITKEVGKVAMLEQAVDPELKSNCGIGHTRWATHGGVTQTNAHPHCYGKITLIHNGIVENYHQLAVEFAKEGRVPVSQTDSEIVAMLLDSIYDGDPYHTIAQAVEHNNRKNTYRIISRACKTL